MEHLSEEQIGVRCLESLAFMLIICSYAYPICLLCVCPSTLSIKKMREAFKAIPKDLKPEERKAQFARIRKEYGIETKKPKPSE